jgi:hypothetical protein
MNDSQPELASVVGGHIVPSEHDSKPELVSFIQEDHLMHHSGNWGKLAVVSVVEEDHENKLGMLASLS